MPQPGFFELYDDARPALLAGTYLLAADQDMLATPPNGASGAIAVDGSDFTFKIISPRFTMPPDQILSTFPPASAEGDWRERLPQIVFKRRTLPWERDPAGSDPIDPNSPPWLALVVLAEGEGTMSAEVDVAQCVTPGVVLDGDGDTARGRYLDVTETIVRRVFPMVDDLRLLCHVRHVDLADTELALGDDDGYLSVVLANRLPQPGPPADDGGPETSVRYTAYLVNLEGQLDVLPTAEDPVFDFETHMPELVMQNLFVTAADVRLHPSQSTDAIIMQPATAFDGLLADGAPSTSGAPQRSAAFRSGIESAAASYATGPAVNGLVRADDAADVKRWIGGSSLTELGGLAEHVKAFPIERRFRFPVLVSWDFICTGTGGFERLMNTLHSGMLGTEGSLAPATAPQITPTGHISLAHRTRRGEATESWYRGPLVPQPTVRIAPAADGSLPIAHTGDQLRKVVPDGHEDVGLAAAFEIGRLLALSKPGIVGALIEWRRELFGAARAAELSKEFVDSLVAGVSDAVLVGRRALADLLTERVLVPYAAKVPDVIGPRSRSFATARVPDDIDELSSADVLGGLGIDVAATKVAVERFGTAGLSTLEPAVGEASTKPLSSTAADLAALGNLLAAHVGDIVVESLKLDRLGLQADGVRGRRRKDELDRFLEQAEQEV